MEKGNNWLAQSQVNTQSSLDQPISIVVPTLLFLCKALRCYGEQRFFFIIILIHCVRCHCRAKVKVG